MFIYMHVRLKLDRLQQRARLFASPVWSRWCDRGRPQKNNSIPAWRQMYNLNRNVKFHTGIIGLANIAYRKERSPFCRWVRHFIDNRKRDLLKLLKGSSPGISSNTDFMFHWLHVPCTSSAPLNWTAALKTSLWSIHLSLLQSHLLSEEFFL